MNIVGNPDETTAVDYTVNAASGIAPATGPVGSSLPVNNALPAWDIATGLNAVIGVLAAERQRRVTGEGQLVKISLADVAFTMVANLGFLGQAQAMHENRPPLGNDMYGAFGRDFATSDGRRVMVVAISLNQWQTLVRATGVEEHLPAMERAFDADFTKEDDRYRAATRIAALLTPWFEARTLDEIRKALDAHGVCWGPYQTFTQLLDDDWRASDRRTRCSATSTTPASACCSRRRRRCGSRPSRRSPPAPAPLLGTHTDEVLADVLGLSPAEIGRLHDDGAGRGRGVSEPDDRADADAHPRATPASRASPTTTCGSSRRTLAACLDADPRCSTAACCRCSWHWACFLPDGADRGARAPTAIRVAGRDGRRSRSACGSAAGCTSTRPLAHRRVARSGRARIVRADAEGGVDRPLLARHRRAHDQRRGASCASRRSRTSCSASRRAVAPAGPDADEPPDAEWVEARVADPVLLFRFSAVTANAHRIHYDQPYATEVEGYPDLVVQGPLTAILLAELARTRRGQDVARSSYRARAPHFANRRFWLAGSPTDDGDDLARCAPTARRAMTLEVR